MNKEVVVVEILEGVSKDEQNKYNYDKVKVIEQSPPPLKQRAVNECKPVDAKGHEGAEEASPKPDDTQQVPQAEERKDDPAKALLEGMNFDLFDK